MATDTTPFIEGWNFVQVLGEGAYGEVKLAVNESGDTAVAIKLIANSEDNARNAEIRKEICIQKMCCHENIIRLYGSRQDAEYVYLLLEYASGGELFDRIEPDIGMEFSECQRLFRQLTGAVAYMFSRGITHRDIKPENLLLDENDNLKVTDFGLATVFRHQGKERQVDKSCGTYPYVAPEVLGGILHPAMAADIWSCGIVLVAMLSGELPWDQPSTMYVEYRNWINNMTNLSPFSKLDMLSLAYLRKILEPDFTSRITIEEVQSHKWMTTAACPVKRPVLQAKNLNDSKRLRSSDDLSQSSNQDSYESPPRPGVSYSQPNPHPNPCQSSQNSSQESTWTVRPGDGNRGQLYSFSQPINTDNMLLSQIPCSQSQSSQSTQSTMQRLVKRMTRYYVFGDMDQVIKDMLTTCDKLGYHHKKNSSHQYTISTTDRRNTRLDFKVCLLDIDGLLLDFRLSRGDGLEFKKCFIKLKNELNSLNLICHLKEPPMLSQSQACCSKG